MVICELCASANNELDEFCRVCGLALQPQANTQAPVTAGTVSQPGAATWPGASPKPVAPPSLSEQDPASALQVSAVKQAPQTGVPPMINQQQEQAHEASEPGTTAMPGFMQSARSNGPQPEPVQLISASDLPDWIKQIAAADDAKAAADEAQAAAEAAANPADPAATIVRRPLPGETLVGGPSTTWLSKSGAATPPNEHWGATEAANAHWGGMDSAEAVASTPVPAPSPPFIPRTADAYSTSKPKGRFSSPARTEGASVGQPVYRRRSVQLIALLALLAVLVLTML
jgi:hypothetical protein